MGVSLSPQPPFTQGDSGGRGKREEFAGLDTPALTHLNL